MEHRIGNFLKGIGLFAVAAGVYLFSMLIFGELICSNCPSWDPYPAGPVFFIFVVTVWGVVFVVRSLFPIKYELKRCPHCGVTTEQFEKKRDVKKKQRTYVCEKCGKENIENTAEDLLNKLISDSQYEDAFKEWWVRTFPEKTYDREAFVSLTREYVYSGHIWLGKEEVRFRGPAKVVGKLYRTRQKEQPKVTQTETVDSRTMKATPSKNVVSPRLESPPHQIAASESIDKKFCRYCGAMIPRVSKFCEECGETLL
jgi:predicted RNA-binding Zn-ribbon protein involved in translation (DUF1610 family)